MSEKNKVVILEGEEAIAHLGDTDLIQLTNRVNEIERGATVGRICHEIALQIESVLRNGELKRKLLQNVDRAFRPIEHMKGLRDRGHIAVAKVDGKTVGMIGFECCGQDSATGKNVYEMRRIGVKKEFEGKGIGGKLHEAMFERVRFLEPGSLVLVETKNPKISAQCKRMGYKPVTIAEGLRLKSIPSEEVEDLIAYHEKQSTTFWIHDVSVEQASDETKSSADE